MKMKSEAKKRSKDNLKQMMRSRRYRTRAAGRVVKYGAQSFTRNAWLSMAAIAIMTITLLVMTVTLVIIDAMGTEMDIVRARVEMSVYIKQDTEQSKIDGIMGRLGQIGSVLDVRYVTPEDANREAIDKIITEQNITDQELIDAMNEAPNKLPWTLNVKIADLNDPSELEYFVYNDDSMRDMLDAKPPSFSSSHREAIDNIANVMRGVEIGGLIAAGVFGVIAILVVFNTIRMAIFNRKEEIYMMKLIGASKSFVRGPFLVEAMMYGLLAGGITSGLTFAGMALLNERFSDALKPTMDLAWEWWWAVVAGLIVTGMLIGVVSALLATRKYLKLR